MVQQTQTPPSSSSREHTEASLCAAVGGLPASSPAGQHTRADESKAPRAPHETLRPPAAQAAKLLGLHELTVRSCCLLELTVRSCCLLESTVPANRRPERESKVWPPNRHPKPDHGKLDHAGHGELDPRSNLVTPRSRRSASIQAAPWRTKISTARAAPRRAAAPALAGGGDASSTGTGADVGKAGDGASGTQTEQRRRAQRRTSSGGANERWQRHLVFSPLSVRTSRDREIRRTWYEMPRARARRCALKTTERRPLARTTARVTGAKFHNHEKRGARNSGGLGGDAALHLPKRGAAGPIGEARWKQGREAAAPPPPVRSVRVSPVAQRGRTRGWVAAVTERNYGRNMLTVVIGLSAVDGRAGDLLDATAPQRALLAPGLPPGPPAASPAARRLPCATLKPPCAPPQRVPPEKKTRLHLTSCHPPTAAPFSFLFSRGPVQPNTAATSPRLPLWLTARPHLSAPSLSLSALRRLPRVVRVWDSSTAAAPSYRVGTPSRLGAHAKELEAPINSAASPSLEPYPRLSRSNPSAAKLPRRRRHQSAASLPRSSPCGKQHSEALNPVPLALPRLLELDGLEVESTLEQEIRKGQLEDEEIKELVKKIGTDKAPGFRLDDQGTVWYGNRIVVPDQQHIKDVILREAHESAYSIHPGSTKMYLDLKERFWWYGLKRDVAAHVALCDVCQRVKAEHQRPAGLLQPMKIPEWKWEEVGMDFITGLPRTPKGYDSIWVIVDRLTKVAHFIPTDGQTERTNQILEDIFEIGDFVYLKVSPMRGVKRFNVKGKLAPRYIGPFKILERRGEVAYQLELPEKLAGVHDVFHVSQLKKCLRVPEEQIPLEELNVQEDLTYEEYPVKILEESERYPLEARNLDAYRELLRQEAEEGNPEELQHQSEGPAPCIATTQKDLIQHPSSPHHYRP
nr:unnamed protein product [Digitaria exilis]